MFHFKTDYPLLKVGTLTCKAWIRIFGVHMSLQICGSSACTLEAHREEFLLRAISKVACLESPFNV